jgi:hypothetical protein
MFVPIFVKAGGDSSAWAVDYFLLFAFVSEDLHFFFAFTNLLSFLPRSVQRTTILNLI